MAAPAAAAAASSSSFPSSSAFAAPAPAAESTIGPPECPVCTESYECDEAVDPSRCRLPRTLPCAHSVCSACLLRLLLASPGRNKLKCPTCRDERPVRSRAGMTPAALVRLVPQNGDIVQLIRRSAQLESLQHEQQRAQSTLPSAAPLGCSYGDDCAEPAVRWCEECDAAACSAHDASIHAHSLSVHTRMTLAQKEAARRAKVAAVLAAAGAQVKAAAASAVQQQKIVVAQKLSEVAEQQRLLVEQRILMGKQRQADASAALLAQMEAEAARLAAMSDIEAQQQEAQLVQLLAGARRADSHIPAPASASGLLASLTPEELGHLRRFLGGNGDDDPLAPAELLYCATRHGFQAGDLWAYCEGEGPTLTLVQVRALQPHYSAHGHVARNGFIFGAFTPLSWPENASFESDDLADPSGRTFLFSLVNAHGRPVKLRLKPDAYDQALCLLECEGPGFGEGADLRLMDGGRPANHPMGCCVSPYLFELDQETELAAGLPPIPFAYDKTLLAGDDGRGRMAVDFVAAEIEVYRL